MDTLNNTRFIAFTSAAGGTGCTSSAIAFSRIVSKLSKLKLIYLSFDLLSLKMKPLELKEADSKECFLPVFSLNDEQQSINKYLVTDEFGVSYFTDASFFNPLHSIDLKSLEIFLEYISKDFDLAVLDIPFTFLNSLSLLQVCEDIVVCSGYLKSQRHINEKLFELLKEIKKDNDLKINLHTFTTSEDKDSFDLSMDIHADFGAEVRELVSELIDSL